MIDDALNFANDLADKVRPVLLRAFHEGVRYQKKDDGSPVTATDREVELILRDAIAGRFPQHGILGEEFGATGAERSCVWVLDPIDGTRAFSAGLPCFGCLISLCVDGVPVVGVIELPVAGLRALGAKGCATLCNRTPVRTRDCRDLAHAVLGDWTNNTSMPDPPGKARLNEAVNWSIRDGGCANYVSLARGYVDICIDGNLDPYDFCALVPVVEGAGGCITDWRGAPLTMASGSLVVASATMDCHRAALELLHRFD